MIRWLALLALVGCSSGGPAAKTRDAAPVVVAPPPAASPAPPSLIGPIVLRDGEPVAGAEIVLWGRATELDGAPLARVVTGADGRFALDAVPPGATLIGAFAPGSMPVIADLPLRFDPAEVFLHVGACDDPYEVLVVDPRGRPIAGARLTDEFRHGLVFAETGRDGRATACYRGAVSVVADGFATAQPLDGSGTVRLAVERTATGTTEPGVIVEAMWDGPASDDDPLYFATRADQRGRFTLRGLAPGTLSIWARKIWPEGEQQTNEVDVEIGDRGVRPVKLPIPALELHDIEVSDVDGPLGDLEFGVWAVGEPYRQWSGVTDRQGRARAPAGGVSVRQREGDKITKGNPVRHVLSRLPSLVGRVTHEGVPVAGASIWITGDGSLNSAQSDATGRFLAQMFRTGQVRVDVESRQLGVAAYLDLVVVDGFNQVDVALTAAASVSGAVVDRTGRPMPAVQVRILDRARSRSDQASWLRWAADTTNDEGRFRIVGLPGGSPPLGFDVLPIDTYDYDDDLFPVLGDPATVTLPDDTTAIEGMTIVLDVERIVTRP